MPRTKQRVIIDSNIWISFAIGKHLKHLTNLLNNQYIEVYICDEIIAEINDVLKRPKLAKYINAAWIKELNEIIALATIKGEIYSTINISRDFQRQLFIGFCKRYRCQIHNIWRYGFDCYQSIRKYPNFVVQNFY